MSRGKWGPIYLLPPFICLACTFQDTDWHCRWCSTLRFLFEINFSDLSEFHVELQTYWILAVNAALSARRCQLALGVLARRIKEKVNRKLPSWTKLGIVAIEQKIRTDLCHSLSRHEEHTRYHMSTQSSLDGFIVKWPHPALTMSSMKSYKCLRKPDWGNPLPVRGNVLEAAQLACYWLSNWTQCSIGLIPKGTTTAWFFQLPCRGLAVIIHGNLKNSCLSKLYNVWFAIIYYVVYSFIASDVPYEGCFNSGHVYLVVSNKQVGMKGAILCNGGPSYGGFRCNRGQWCW